MNAPSRTLQGSPPVKVAFVGAGPGDPGLMTVRSRELLAAADVVVTDQLTGEHVVARYARDDVVVVDAGHGEHGEQLTRASRAKRLVQAAKSLSSTGGLVVRLMDGDPAFFTGLCDEANALRKANIPFDVVPGVSAVSAVPTYAGVPLTSSDVRSVQVVSAGSLPRDWSGSLDPDGTVVLLGTPDRLAAALGDLVAAGRDPQTPVALVEHGTTNEQTTRTTTLGEVDAVLNGTPLLFPSLAVVGSTVALREAFSWFESKPLFGWKVLVPRTKDQSTTMVDRLGEYGAQPTVVPTISVEPPRTPHQMDRAVTGLVTGRYEWIGFTSVNAVRAVREKFEQYGLDARAFAGLKIAAVGGVTAAALRDWGLEPDLVPSGEQSTAGLLADWPEYDSAVDPINRVFLPRADIATDTLVAGLLEMGWEVDDVTAYRTVRAAPPPAPVREAIKSGQFDAVLFTSSSTVRNLVGIAGKPHPSTVVACIGPQTAKTAEEHGMRVDVMAKRPSAEGLVDALAAHGALLALAAAEHGDPVLRPSERRHPSRRKAR